MEFKELTLEEITNGFVRCEEKQSYQCIFCGEEFENGRIYQSRGELVNALRAVQEHIFDKHGGVFESLLEMDKQVNGLSDTQKDVLEGLYRQKDNKKLCEEMGITPATVRTHKFNLQRMKREAKIFRAIMEQSENEEILALRKRLEPEAKKMPEDYLHFNPEMTGNTLHPFFTQYNLK